MQCKECLGETASELGICRDCRRVEEMSTLETVLDNEIMEALESVAIDRLIDDAIRDNGDFTDIPDIRVL